MFMAVRDLKKKTLERFTVRGGKQEAHQQKSIDSKWKRNYSGKKDVKEGKKSQKKGSEAWLYYILICLPYSASEQKSAET